MGVGATLLQVSVADVALADKPAHGGVYVITTASSAGLAVTQDSDTAEGYQAIALPPSHRDRKQEWFVTERANPEGLPSTALYRISDVAQKRCLDATSTATGTKVVVNACNDTKGQRWKINQASIRDFHHGVDRYLGTYYITNAASGLALSSTDTKGGGLTQSPMSLTATQHFVFKANNAGSDRPLYWSVKEQDVPPGTATHFVDCQGDDVVRFKNGLGANGSPGTVELGNNVYAFQVKHDDFSVTKIQTKSDHKRPYAPDGKNGYYRTDFTIENRGTVTKKAVLGVLCEPGEAFWPPIPAGTPNVVEDCKNIEYPPAASMMISQCFFKIAGELPIDGEWTRVGATTNNCEKNDAGPIPMAKSSSHAVNSSFSVGNGKSVNVTSGLAKVFSAAIGYSRTWDQNTQWGSATTVTDTQTVNVPPGKIGWWEFQPRLMVSSGWMVGKYLPPTLWWMEREGATIDGAMASWFSYPAADTTLLKTTTPVLLSSGLADGEWRPGFVACHYNLEGSSGKVAEIANGSHEDGAQAQIYSKLNENKQKWELVSRGDDQYAIASVESGKCLDVHAQDKTRVIQWSCHLGDNQLWKIESLSNSLQRIKSVWGEKCLQPSGGSTANGTHLTIADCTGGTAQQWRLLQNGSGDPLLAPE
ncbi:RICIN domain-containing protein [Streptomyces spinoverrucosus]|uniref:RICIN domain-containing protein n=1 Tax=Streptomyces spinoverrucosus TaxID=284043 RepID=UPI00142E948B|nr:RICIN domain-containing protein [Streptomyces spinoverrucosus]